MMQIWKFPLNTFGSTIVSMPENAKVISAGESDGKVCIWAEVDPKAATIGRFFFCAGTGNDTESFEKLKFIDTVKYPPLVIHVYEDFTA